MKAVHQVVGVGAPAVRADEREHAALHRHSQLSSTPQGTPLTLNMASMAMKRIRGDVKELARHPSPVYFALPLEDNMFELT